MSDELKNLVDEIEAEEAATNAAKEPVAELPEEQGRPDAAAEALAIISTVTSLAVNFWPFLKPIYPPAVVENLAQAWAPVMEHYGWTAKTAVSHPLAQAALVTFPVALATYQAFTSNQGKQETAPIEHEAPVEKPQPGQVVLEREHG